MSLLVLLKKMKRTTSLSNIYEIIKFVRKTPYIEMNHWYVINKQQQQKKNQSNITNNNINTNDNDDKDDDSNKSMHV